jgi:hypothetical protein
MSYVIQNFYKPSFYIVNTPKFKHFIILINLSKLLLFLKFYNIIYDKNWYLNNSNIYLNSFLKYFFNLNIFKYLLRLDDKTWFYYTNNFLKSLIFWKFKTALKFLSKPNKINLEINFLSQWCFNSSLLTIKTAPLAFIKKSYKNIFFFNLFYVAHYWPQLACSFKFYLNFFLISNFFFLFKFYNGPFFKIYNF